MPALSREEALKTVEGLGLKVFEARLAILRCRFSTEEGTVYVAEESVPKKPVWVVVIDVEGEFGSGGPGWPTPDAKLRTGGFVVVDAVTRARSLRTEE